MKAYDTDRVLHWDKPTMESTFHAPAGQNIQQFAPSGAACPAEPCEVGLGQGLFYLICRSIPNQVKKNIIRSYPLLSVAK
jgi:hypothetical protein